jgi:hypothetical protein
MSPDDSFMVTSENGYSRTLSTDAFGIVCCLYAYSHLTFSGNENLGELCARHFHLLWDLSRGGGDSGCPGLRLRRGREGEGKGRFCDWSRFLLFL